MIPHFFAGLSGILTIIATLRAGSRALYILRHNGTIGLLEGELILGPKDTQSEDDISPLWEAVHAFQMAVNLQEDEGAKTIQKQMEVGVSPLDAEGLLSLFQEPPSNATVEPYSLSPYPSTTHANKEDMNATTEEALQEFIPVSKTWKKRFKVFATPILYPVQRFQSIMVTVKRRWSRFISPMDYCFEDGNNDQFIEELSILCNTIALPPTQKNSTSKVVAHLSSYAVPTFQNLRKIFNVDESKFLATMRQGPFVSFASNSKGAARAGLFFFFSRGGTYLIKAVKKSEAQSLLNILPRYHRYMKRCSRSSLLTRFFGLYHVSLNTSDERSSYFSKKKQEKEYYFIVMNAVFPTEGNKFISEKFDLKGSTVGRECSPEERMSKGNNAILKDLDLAKECYHVRRSSSSSTYGFHIGPRAKAALLSQLRRDVRFLVETGVMDYSLLIGVADMEATSTSPTAVDSTRQMTKLECDTRPTTFALSPILQLIKILVAPSAYIIHILSFLTMSTLSTVLTLPLPYYGAGMCGVHGGQLSVMQGSRLGHRSLYYFGLIDFLQPWTMRKVLEKELKGLLGYDTRMISSVPPKDYADRFLDFIDTYVT